MKRKISLFLLIALLVIGLQGNVYAASDNSNSSKEQVTITNYNDVMPSDVIAVLEATNTSDLLSATTSNSDVLTNIELPRSMNIKTPKIDMKKVHDTNPLEELQIENLKNHGYSNQEIKNMDAGDYNEIEKTWKIPASDIPIYKSSFPELENVDISNWTIGEYLAYDEAAAAKANIYSPTSDQVQAFALRNIDLCDARMLLKDFYSYDNILQQSDETLKNYIEAYYQFTIDNIYEMDKVNNKGTKSIQSLNSGKFFVQAPPSNLQGTTYRYVNFPGGYGYDWFHQSSQTHVSDAIRQTQKNAVIKGYNRLYKLTGTVYSCGNLWGTWSNSQGGAHEGIDYNYGTNPTIYTMATGSVYYYYNNYSTRSQICVTGGSKTYTYLHMATINIKNNGVVTGPTYPSGVNVTAGSSALGTQGSIGNSTANHVHFEVHSGSTINLFTESDNTLSCLDPYAAINLF